MITHSKYTKVFKSKDMTRLKYDELYDFAVLIRNHKNIVSKYVNNNLLHYLEYNKFDFLKEMRELYKGIIPSSFDAQLYTQLFDCYQNKFDSIQRKLKFEKVTYICCETYKRDTKKHKKGDFKKVNNKKEQTPLSNCLTYLARYGNENTLEYITKQLVVCDEKKKLFYENIIDKCNKFSFERLFNLALRKRQRIIQHYSEQPIEFKSLTFSGRSRKTKIVDYNSKYGSVINSFISLSGLGRKSFDIPITFSKDYHVKIKDYYKKNPDYEYILTFNEKEHQVNIHLCKDGERYIPEVNDTDDIIGIDVNIKHNLFTLSNNESYNYDRKLVNDYSKLCVKIDNNKKQQGKDYKVGKKLQHKVDVISNKIKKSNQQLISTICKHLQGKGVRHIVMENLDNGFSKNYIKDKSNENINFNRIIKVLNISSLKDEFIHIARKYDIAVSLVQSYYTSKMCPICGCIEDDNRLCQEAFSCIDCGYEENADVNAAINIRNRVLVTVLRDKLLKQLDNGAFEPKKLKREKVKEVLLSFRRNLQRNVGSKSTESIITTFEYF